MSKIVVIGKKKCKYCVMAVQHLNDHGFKFLKKTLGVDIDQSEIDDIKEATGAKTYPIIFVDSKYIGGYTELCTLELKHPPAGSDGDKFEITDDF